MSTQYEQTIIAGYILNILKGKPPRSSLAKLLVQWAGTKAHNLVGEISYKPSSKQEDKFRLVVSRLEKVAQDHRSKRTDILDVNIKRLGKVLGCDDTDIRILELAARLKSSTYFLRFLEETIEDAGENPLDLIVQMVDYPRETIIERLSRNSRLCQNGVLAEGDFSAGRRYLGDITNVLDVKRAVYKALITPHKNNDFFYNCLIGKPEKSSLSCDDFLYMKDTQEFIARLLKNALKKRQTGINILLYGIPGTGKTELCKTIAAHLKLPLYSIAEQEGYDLKRGDRIKKLCLANTLLEKDGRALLLFDEMEDILSANLLTGESRSGENAGSKVFVNRMLEKNALPTFWTANDVSSCDPAILRRMTLAIEMKAPPRHSRKVVLKRILDQEKLHLPENEIHSLAYEFDDAPALIKNAVRAVSLAGGKKDQVKFVLKNSRKAMGRRARNQQSENSIKFMPELTNADLDLASFTNLLARKDGSRNFSLCLHGPAGTGKSAYARYLAEKIGMEVMHMRASDLISMWVGETERKIAEAFEKAVADGAFLIFDEADSFLRDRHLSKSSWEVTAVNEMLTWMESHPLPFACTTNLMEMLDAASLRRFTFKMCFDYMTPDQVAVSFRHFFSLEPPPSIMALGRLTPGDFALVRNKAEIIGQADDPQAILTMLCQECAAKPGGVKPIGFIAA